MLTKVSGQAQESSSLDRVLESLGRDSSIDSRSLLDALTAVGPRGLSELLDAMAGEGMALDPTMQKRLEQALVGIPKLVSRRQSQAEGSEHRRGLELSTAMRVLQFQGKAAEFKTALRLATPAGSSANVDQAISNLLSDTVAQLLRNDPSIYPDLKKIYTATDRRLQSALLVGIGSVPSLESLLFLEDQLGINEELSSVVLGQIGRVGQILRMPLDQRTHTYLMRNLASPEVTTRREACTLVGRLEDCEAIPELISLLVDPDLGVQANALWALKKITLKTLGPDQERWRRWYTKELAWWSLFSSEISSSLVDPDLATLAAALRALSAHRTFRHQLAEAILPLLEHENASIVQQVISALQSLQSKCALKQLGELQDSPNRLIRDQARKAYRALGGSSV